jgi:hypothetical protein
VADDITLNSGSGGASMRTLEDTNSKHWVPAVATYATTVGTPDVLQVVTPSLGLPVAQATAGNLLCTASQGGTWSVTANAGTGTFTISGAVTQSGTWNVGTVTTVSAVTAITNVVHVDDNSGSLTVDNGGTFAVQAAQSGTWNVVNSAGTNLIGAVSSSNETATIYNGTTALTPKFAAISASSSGDNSVVALVSGKKIRVLRWSVSGSGTVNIKWRNGTTDITGLYYLVANAAVGGSYCPVGHFETSAGAALQLNLSGATAVGGVITYIEV